MGRLPIWKVLMWGALACLAPRLSPRPVQYWHGAGATHMRCKRHCPTSEDPPNGWATCSGKWQPENRSFRARLAMEV